MTLLRLLWYYIPFNYHLKKKDQIDSKHKTVMQYHYEMSQHYYKKIYKKDFIG